MDIELYFMRNLVIFLGIYSDVLCICKRKKNICDCAHNVFGHIQREIRIAER